MLGDGKHVSPQEVVAFGVGLGVTVASAVITSVVHLVPFPFNFLISFALGGTAFIGAKLVAEDTPGGLLDKQTRAEYRLKLQEIAAIAARVEQASRSTCLDAAINEQLGGIARLIGKILKRYQERRMDFAGASKLLEALRRFDEIQGFYLNVKCGDLFLDNAMRETLVTEIERRTIPTFAEALRNVGKQLDSGEALDREISMRTLDSILRSLNLIESLGEQLDSTPQDDEGDPS